MESTQNPESQELEFTSYLDEFSTKSESENITTFESWFKRDEYHYCNSLMAKMEENSAEWLKQSVEAQALKQDFEIYEKTVGLIDQLNKGEAQDWKKFVAGGF